MATQPATKPKEQPPKSMVSDGVLLIIGFILIVVTIALLLLIPRLSPLLHDTLKVMLALGAAAISAALPGTIGVQLPDGVKAGGSLAIFVIVLFVPISRNGIAIHENPFDNVQYDYHNKQLELNLNQRYLHFNARPRYVIAICNASSQRDVNVVEDSDGTVFSRIYSAPQSPQGGADEDTQKIGLNKIADTIELGHSLYVFLIRLDDETTIGDETAIVEIDEGGKNILNSWECTVGLYDADISSAEVIYAQLKDYEKTAFLEKINAQLNN